MIYNVPMLSVNLWFFQQWALHKNVLRKWLVLGLTTLLNFGQISDLIINPGSIQRKIRNAFIVTLWFNGVVRGWIFYIRKAKFINFMEVIEDFSNEINFKFNDPDVIQILEDTTNFAKKWNYLNLIFGVFTIIAFTCGPIFSDTKDLPYGFYLPFVNKMETPYFQIIYVSMVLVSFLGCHIYIPLSNLFVNFMMFGTSMCRILQLQLEKLYFKENSEQNLMEQIVWCISYHRKLVKYIEEFNSLISILFLIEFALFGIILCALLFLMATITDVANIVIVCVYIITMLSQISAFAWFANELYDESLAIANASYECYWYNYSKQVKMTISMLILRSQKPLAIRMGNVYDMNLQSLQSLLNVTYTTFTLLKRLYSKR